MHKVRSVKNQSVFKGTFSRRFKESWCCCRTGCKESRIYRPTEETKHKEATARIEAELAQEKLELEQMKAKKQIETTKGVSRSRRIRGRYGFRWRWLLEYFSNPDRPGDRSRVLHSASRTQVFSIRYEHSKFNSATHSTASGRTSISRRKKNYPSHTRSTADISASVDTDGHLNRHSDSRFIQHESPASTWTDHIQRWAHPLSRLEVICGICQLAI